MAEWGNGQGVQAEVAMDSNGQKLKVRSASGTGTMDYRLEIEEADDANRRALRVKGDTKLENLSSPFFALTVDGATTLQRQVSQQNGNSTLSVTGGPTTLQGLSGAGQKALDVTGKTVLRPLNAGDPALVTEGAIEAEGDIRLERGGTYCGTIVPNAEDPQNPVLEINTESGDPDVHIGGSGNDTKLNSDHVWIGVTADTDHYVTAIRGPVLINANSGGLEPREVRIIGDVLRIDNSQGADTTIYAGSLDAPTNAQLNIGATVDNVYIGQNEHDTVIQGRLVVDEFSDLRGRVLVGGNLGVSGNVDTSLTIDTAQEPQDLDLNGNGDVSGDLTVHAKLERPGSLKVTGTVAITAATSIIQSSGDVSLSVKQDNPVSPVTALKAETVAGGWAVEAVGANALRATGETTLDGDTTITGTTTHQDSVLMDGQPIILGGSGATESRIVHDNDPIEFMVGGQLRFYIDNTGGHNA